MGKFCCVWRIQLCQLLHCPTQTDLSEPALPLKQDPKAEFGNGILQKAMFVSLSSPARSFIYTDPSECRADMKSRFGRLTSMGAAGFSAVIDSSPPGKKSLTAACRSRRCLFKALTAIFSCIGCRPISRVPSIILPVPKRPLKWSLRSSRSFSDGLFLRHFHLV